MRSYMSAKWLCSALAAAAIIAAAPRSADAEEAIALDRFHPSFAGDRMFGVPSPFAAGRLGIHVALLGEYAQNPLVVRREADNERVGSIVGSQFFLHVNGTFALFNRIAVNVDAPIALFQSGDNPP